MKQAGSAMGRPASSEACAGPGVCPCPAPGHLWASDSSSTQGRALSTGHLRERQASRCWFLLTLALGFLSVSSSLILFPSWPPPPHPHQMFSDSLVCTPSNPIPPSNHIPLSFTVWIFPTGCCRGPAALWLSSSPLAWCSLLQPQEKSPRLPLPTPFKGPTMCPLG